MAAPVPSGAAPHGVRNLPRRPAAEPGPRRTTKAAAKRLPKAEMKEAKAEARVKRRLTAPAGSDLTELEIRTVGKETRAVYEAADAEFAS